MELLYIKLDNEECGDFYVERKRRSPQNSGLKLYYKTQVLQNREHC